MDGQAQAPESDGLAELANFLSDEPIEESEEEGTTDESTQEDTDSDGQTQSDDANADNGEEGDPDAVVAEEEPATERKIPVTIKADDGTEEKLEVTEAELVKGYHRQADYTRKTQALAERENQAVQVFQQKHSELRDNYLQRTEFATQAIAQLAGFRSDAEMAQLAAQDPATWVAENQRQTQIRQILGTLEQQSQAERQNAAQQAAQYQDTQLKAVKERSWAELQKDGMDKPKLQKTYESVMKNYGYEPKDFATVTDYRLVRMMADAVAYRELKSKAPAVTQKAKEAPKMQNKQFVPAKLDAAREARFKSGRAKLNDLAAYFN
jgi:hypothetical protein